jgi:phage-related holin
MNKVSGFWGTLVSVSMHLAQVVQNKFWLAVSAVTSAGLLNYVEEYNSLINVLVICVFSDSLFGIWISIKKKKFEWAKAFRIVEKIVVYFFYLWISHSIAGLTFLEKYDFVDYLHVFIYVIMIINEGKSAFKNGNIIYPNKISGMVVSVFDLVENQARARVGIEKNKQ